MKWYCEQQQSLSVGDDGDIQKEMFLTYPSRVQCVTGTVYDPFSESRPLPRPPFSFSGRN